MTNTYRRFTVSLLVLVASTSDARAQACLGRPQRSSLAYEYGKRTVGTTNGATGTLAGGPVAFTVGGRARSIAPDLSGWEAGFGFDVVISASKVKICPGIGLQYQHDTWNVSSATSLTSHALDATGGLALGIEQEVYKGFSLIPFVAVRYRFNAIAFDLKSEGDRTVTGDTLSGVNIDYGMSGHYRFAWAGVALNRTSKNKGSRPAQARYLFGVTLGNSEPKKSGAK